MNLIPHFILQKFAAGERHGRLPAIVLYVDVSGFTPLTAALLQHQHDGAEALSETLAQIFQPLVEMVYAWGGFISHFSGDALTAVFPTMPDKHAAVHAAWQTAAAVQQHLSSDGQPHPFATRYGTFAIGVKSGLAAGDLAWGIPERDGKHTYYFRGAAIDRAVQMATELGQVRVHRSVRVHHFVAGDMSLPQPLPDLPSLPPISPDQLRPFIANAILDMPLQADFRTICPVFLSFQAPAESGASGAIHDFAGQVMELTAEYGGVFSRMEFGDKGGLMVLWFGAPLSHENNTERAARCLLALAGRTRHLPVPWRAGLTEGLVWAGIRGAPVRGEYTAFGTVVNTAAHIAVNANWGEIWLDDTAVPALQPLFTLHPLGPQTLKQRAVPLYRLLAESQPNPLYRGQMVGRQEELAQVTAAIQPVFDGRFAGLIGVHGEAGMGKSRLLAALRQQLADQVRWLECSTDDILRQSLNPFRAMLRATFQQLPERAAAANQALFLRKLADIQQQLAANNDPRAQAVTAELQRTHSLLAALVGLHLPDSLAAQLEPRLRFENSLIALQTFIQAQALIGPVVLHLADAHWLDDDSRHFLGRLCRQMAGYPVAVILSGRYQDDGILADWWADLPAAQRHIYLNALTAPDVDRLCQQLLAQPVAADLVVWLLAKGNGNPFFTEQLALELAERHLLVDDGTGRLRLAQAETTAMPASLNALLITRLDRLPAPVKQVVQTAAVLGQSVDVPVLAGMAPEPARLPSLLQQAADRQMGAYLDNQRFIFKHALLREAAYEMQPRAHLRQLHQQAATAVRQLYAADLAAHWGEMAHHLETAYRLGFTGIQAEARACLQEAGHVAARQYQLTAALDFYGRALTLTPPDDKLLRSDLLLWQEEVVEWQGNRAAQQQLLAELDRLAPALDVPRQTAVALRQARFATLHPDYDHALAYAQHALALALTTDDPLLPAQAQRRLGTIHYRRLEFAQAVSALQAALQLAQAQQATPLIIECLNDLGMALDEQGHFAEAQVYYGQAIALQKEINDLYGESITLNNLGWQQVILGDTVAAQRYYEQALRLARQIGHRMSESNGATNVGVMAFLHGDFGQAQQYYQRALHLCQETGNRRGEANMYANLALLAVYQGDYEQALTYGQTAVTMGQAWGGSGLIAEGYLAIGHANRHLGQLNQAQVAYEQGRQIWAASARPFRAVEPLAGLAEIALAQGALPPALAYVAQILPHAATEEYAGMYERFWVDLVCFETLRRAGDERADGVLATAIQALQDKAQKIADPATRTLFQQNFPAHRRLLALAGGISN
ncbi:MAG: tetratricopeptide repeat protein [Chloroflexi bacterium]|nr:tetratricopeptide repeat protein [Ardenticatenaceae bacterium]NOG35158.1 tetratricopeptide repeat protein [Chloroflexota bacterium]